MSQGLKSLAVEWVGAGCGSSFLADGELTDEDAHKFSRLSCGLQGTPLGYFSKPQAIQGLNHVVDTSRRTNKQDFDGFAIGSGFGRGFTGNMKRRRFSGIGQNAFIHGDVPGF